MRIPIKMKSWLCNGGILLSLALSEAMLAPTQWLSSDNMWHFKWASDILAANPIFWSGVDANRIFPDLGFSLIAAALPGGQYFDAWVIYYFCISGLSLGLSLILLSHPLYSESSERILFFSVSCAAFAVVTGILSFWSFWIMAPGNHGGSLSAVIVAIALFLMTIKADRTYHLLLFIFALICTFLVMSNRYLVVCLMVPLLIAALSATQGRLRQIVLIWATLLSTAAGLIALRLLNLGIFDFYRLIAGGRHPSLDDFLSLIWWEGRIPKERLELVNSTPLHQIILGLVVIGAVTIWGFLGVSFKKANENSTLTLRRSFGLIIASSAVCAVLFVTVMVDDTGAWRYRYFVIPFCLSVIGLSAIVVYPFGFKRQEWIAAGGMSVLVLIISSASLAFNISARTYQARFQSDLRQLSRVLASHDGMTIHNGFANYWIANEVSVRSADIKVLAIGELYYGLYNNNAWELCRNRKFSFILVWEEKDQSPTLTAVINQIGLPLSRQIIQLGRFGPVHLLFYDPELLDKVIVQPGRAVARHKFSHFQCPNSSR
jgi:hypothetical protein